jgi:hypothetical protein
MHPNGIDEFGQTDKFWDRRNFIKALAYIVIGMAIGLELYAVHISILARAAKIQLPGA